MKKRILALGLCLGLMLSLAGCGGRACGSEALREDLMADVQAEAHPVSVELKDAEMEALAVADFSVRLFQESEQKGENTLVSPLSVLCALAMTANGARGETLDQMESVLGLSIEQLNAYLYAYRLALPSGEKHQLNLANSIWIKEDSKLQVEKDFLQSNADWYDADVYRAPFDDSTVKAINAWVKEQTEGMIPDILDRLSADTVLCLVNALAFQAEWQRIYYEHQVSDGLFTTEDGSQRAVEFMYSDEFSYLDDGRATGFMKFYNDQAYAFVALLPNEGTSLSDYIASLTGESLRALLSNAQETEVETAIPKFESTCALEMGKILQTMGMTDIFDPARADLSGVGTTSAGPLYVDRVLHKTFLTVDERGTKAGAATVVAEAATAEEPPDQKKTVYLDRPFLYLIVDREAGLPIFMGTVTDIRS